MQAYLPQTPAVHGTWYKAYWSLEHTHKPHDKHQIQGLQAKHYTDPGNTQAR